MRALLVFLAACSPAQKPVADVAPAPTGTASATSAKSDRCPASFRSAGPSCKAGDNPGTCGYPEGNCYCGNPPYCGGAAPPPPPPPHWICEPARPPCPAAGTPCSGNASCSSGPCGWEGVVACVNGKWTPQMVAPPP